MKAQRQGKWQGRSTIPGQSRPHFKAHRFFTFKTQTTVQWVETVKTSSPGACFTKLNLMRQPTRFQQLKGWFQGDSLVRYSPCLTQAKGLDQVLQLCQTVVFGQSGLSARNKDRIRNIKPAQMKLQLRSEAMGALTYVHYSRI